MAQFTTSLSEPNASYQSFAPTRSGGESELASLISGGMQVFETLQRRKAAEEEQRLSLEATRLKEQKSAAENALVVESINTFTGLQDEAALQSLAADKLAGVIHSIDADGKRTPEEEALLKEAETQVARLDLLDPRKKSIRFNAEYRRLAADPAAAGIQEPLRTIFGKFSSDTAELTKTNIPPAVQKQLEEWYGVQNYYSPEQIGKASGNLVYKETQLKNMVANFGTQKNNAISVAIADIRGTWEAASALYNKTGTLNPEHQQFFREQIMLKQQNAMTLLNQVKAEYLKTGRASEIQGFDQLEQEVMGMYTNAQSMFFGEGLYGDAVDTKRRLNYALELATTVEAMNNPGLSKIVGGAVQTATTAELEQVVNILKANDAVLQEFLPEHERGDVQAAKIKAVRQLMYQLNAENRVPDMIKKGQIDPRYAAFITANGGIAAAKDDAKKMNSQLAILETTVTQGSASVPEFIEILNAKARDITTVSSPEVTQRIRSAGDAYLGYVSNRLKDMNIPQSLFVTDYFGNVSIDPKAGTKYGTAVIQDLNRELKMFNEFGVNYGPQLGGKKALVQELQERVFVKEEKKKEEKSTVEEWGTLQEEANKAKEKTTAPLAEEKKKRDEAAPWYDPIVPPTPWNE